MEPNKETVEGIAQSDDKNILESLQNNFKQDTIKDILKMKFTESKTRINEDAVKLVMEIAKSLVVETFLRASEIAKHNNQPIVTENDIESVVPQMILDYP